MVFLLKNKLLHSETIRPALLLLTDPEFINANEEFLSAHEHFRYNRNKECLNECLKAFETTMKIICMKNQWSFKESDTAKSLIKNLIDNKFLPGYHENQLSAIRQQLESTIPTIRNKNGGHGQGVRKIIVSKSLAKYMLYSTSATICLLVEIQREKSPALKS